MWERRPSDDVVSWCLRQAHCLELSSSSVCHTHPRPLLPRKGGEKRVFLCCASGPLRSLALVFRYEIRVGAHSVSASGWRYMSSPCTSWWYSSPRQASDIVTLTPLFAFRMSRSRRFSDAYVDGFRGSHTSMMSEFKGHLTMYTVIRAFCWSTWICPHNTGKARRICLSWARHDARDAVWRSCTIGAVIQ
jgi:hypothetical protein